MAEESKKGVISAWNEGDYKNLRLHRAQQIINVASMAPFDMLVLPDIGIRKYGYQLWVEGINSLFREGKSKYSEKELEEVRKLKRKCEDLINNNQFLFLVNDIRNKGVGIYPKKWNEVKEKIQEYEDQVYFYNEAHGLSTRNIDDEEDW